MDKSRLTVNQLAKACAHSDDVVEWEHFLRLCAPLVAVVASRVSRLWMGDSSTVWVNDIMQEVFVKLCEQERRILREFRPQSPDSFLALLRVIAGSAASDYFRNMYSVKRGGRALTTPFVEEGHEEGGGGKRSHAQLQQLVLLSQLDRMLQRAPESISDRDRRIFWFYYQQGFTAEEIARLPAIGLTSKGVESALRRVALWLRAEVERRGRVEERGSG